MARPTMARPIMAPWPLVMLAAPLLPFATSGGTDLYLPQIPAALALFALTVVTILSRRLPGSALGEALLLLAGVAAAYAAPLVLLRQGHALAQAGGLWLYLAGATLLLWRVLALLAGVSGPVRLAGPALFGLALVMLWEILTRGFQVPTILLPPPSLVLTAFAANAADLWDDFRQTVLISVLRGYLIGCGAGFLVAILADRVPFLARGLLPLGNLASAVPVVGIAPIMVMWFGFDWQSKAAVIVVMTVFPMLINTLAGLQSAERIQLDLMRSYGAGYWRTLAMLRLPCALPFLFNGLKINSTLALIGAIVAEFFGTPVVGMGFRISTQVARMNLDVVWATIAVAALTGSLLYGALALAERHVTAWHPSFRKR
ncbi:ABC transporter permease subunit [Azospirillum melinis]|uniref:ABC transporter permease subunit n=2 Tax=Azospirillum melinis TaxID=328839 RepID=A0ABX2KJ02_9PROT|nr:ABC transporter permease subunit [Azospirillum melinis]